MEFGEETYKEYLYQVVKYNDGDVIFEEGTAGGWVYIVAYGYVEIHRIIEGKKVIIDRIGKGEVLGETSFFDQRNRSATAQAVGEVGLMRFKEDFLQQEYEKLPNSYKVIMEAMSLRMRSMIQKITLLASNPKILQLLEEEKQKS